MADTKISELASGGQALSTDETVIVRAGVNYRAALGNINTLAVGNLTVSSGIVGTISTAAQTNITSVGTLSSLVVTGNVSAGNVSGTSLSGTLETAAQPNVTLVGTLSSLTVSGTVNNLTLANGTVQTTDGNTSVILSVPVAANSAVAFTAHVTGYEAATGNAYVARAFAGGKNVSGTTTLLGSAVIEEGRDAGLANTVVANIVANDSTDTLDVSVTGETAKTITWTAYVTRL